MAVDGASPRLDALQALLDAVRLRINPNAHLFVRVVDTGESVRGRQACLEFVDEVRAIVGARVAADPLPDAES